MGQPEWMGSWSEGSWNRLGQGLPFILNQPHGLRPPPWLPLLPLGFCSGCPQLRAPLQGSTVFSFHPLLQSV